jgi:hypothetical protein
MYPAPHAAPKHPWSAEACTPPQRSTRTGRRRSPKTSNTGEYRAHLEEMSARQQQMMAEVG